jgi:hypothetical protein
MKQGNQLQSFVTHIQLKRSVFPTHRIEKRKSERHFISATALFKGISPRIPFSQTPLNGIAIHIFRPAHEMSSRLSDFHAAMHSIVVVAPGTATER